MTNKISIQLLFSVSILLSATLNICVAEESTTAEKKADAIVLQAHPSGVTSICYSADGHQLASGGIDNRIIIWNMDTFEPVEVFADHNQAISATSFSPCGKYFASAGYDNVIIVRETRNWQIVLKIDLESYSTAIAFTSDEKLIMGDRDGKVTVFQVPTGKTLISWQAPYSIRSLAISSDNTSMVTSVPVTLWNLQTGEKITGFDGTGKTNYVTLNKNSTLVGSVGYDGIARVWKLNSFEAVATIENNVTLRNVPGPDGRETITVNMPLAAMAFDKDGKWLVYAGTNKEIRVWNLRENILATTLNFHSMTVTSLCFSPDSSSLASASLDGTIRISDLKFSADK